jgi:hypothetical protein
VAVACYFATPAVAAVLGSLAVPALLTDLPAYIVSLFGG